MGKYLRHVASWTISALVTWLGLDLTQAATDDLTAGLTVVLVLVMGALYAVLEKFLKRFRWLDPEGHQDRLFLKASAANDKKWRNFILLPFFLIPLAACGEAGPIDRMKDGRDTAVVDTARGGGVEDADTRVDREP